MYENLSKMETEYVDLKHNRVCRVCLNDIIDDSLFLFKSETATQISDMIMDIARIEIASEDGFPTEICKICFTELEISIGFKDKCVRSDNILRNCVIPPKNVDVSETATSFKKAKKKKKTNSKKENLDVNSETVKYELENDIFNDLCNFDSDTELNVLKSELEKEKSVGFICRICLKPLKTEQSLERHKLLMHTRETKHQGSVTGFGEHRRFHCSRCAYTTKHSQSLVYHMRVHSGEKPHACHLCDKRFAQPGSLTGHLRTHSDRTYFTCADCGKQFKYKESYTTHLNVHVTEKKYICTICNQGLKSKKTLAGHMNRHYNIRNFSCETCGATFVTQVELLNHSKKHASEKRFHCSICDFKTYLKKGLECHIKRHMGDRKFKCSNCDVACFTRGELKCHMRTHTREKSFHCPICGFGFIHSSSVNKHVLKVHGMKYSRKDTVDRRVVKPEILPPPLPCLSLSSKINL